MHRFRSLRCRHRRAGQLTVGPNKETPSSINSFSHVIIILFIFYIYTTTCTPITRIRPYNNSTNRAIESCVSGWEVGPGRLWLDCWLVGCV